MSFVYPNGGISQPTVSSPFGPRPRPKPGASAKHMGADLVGFATIRAVGTGRVVGAGILPGWQAGGYQVVVDHGGGVVTRYMHMKAGSLLVEPGDFVNPGDPLGTMGKTGTATGVHLHFEVRIRGVAVEPLSWIRARLAVPVVSNPAPAPLPGPVNIGDDEMPWKIVGSANSGKKYLMTGSKYVHIPNPAKLKIVERIIKMQETGKPDVFNDVEHGWIVSLLK